MDSDTSQPLLADTEANLHPEQTKASGHQPQHLCARCCSELDDKDFKINYRLILILVAILFSIIVFSLLAGHMGDEGGATAVGILATLLLANVVYGTSL
ncbi:hypothetical protein B0H19DRAFT_1252146 [Mycena capillaripes]|nr:hypothetical protein B0H19DRAFT_1277857 [Mycena capillaripes]KAJ6581998.1 hypothetical protein B0H19DRAFT_1252146 [Mycena capillaripes]